MRVTAEAHARRYTVKARTAVGRTLAVLLSLGLSQAATPLVYADGHLVGSGQVSAAVADHAASRAAQVKAVQALLDTDEARQQAGLLGASLPKLRAAIPHLSDAELADLSARSQSVKDVAAGHHDDDALIILAIVLVAAGVALLVAVGDGGYYDDCGCYY
jgi:hypothetical protein